MLRRVSSLCRVQRPGLAAVWSFHLGPRSTAQLNTMVRSCTCVQLGLRLSRRRVSGKTRRAAGGLLLLPSSKPEGPKCNEPYANNSPDRDARLFPGAKGAGTARRA